MSQGWNNTTANQRDDWDAYAALAAQDLTNSLGETYSVSGFAWFVALNIARRQDGRGIKLSGPSLSLPATPIVTNFKFFETASASNTRFLLDVASPTLTEAHVVKAFVVNSEAHEAQAEVRPFMILADPNGSREVPFQNEAEAAFGTLQLGQKLFATIAIQNSEGRRGTLVARNAKAEA